MWLAVRQLKAVRTARSGVTPCFCGSPPSTAVASLARSRPSSVLLGNSANKAPFLTCKTLLEKIGKLRSHDSRSTNGRMVDSSTVVASGGSHYESACAGADSRLDALWLPPDATTVDESTILPLVLRESWERNLPIFSSSVLHVKKGALFALFPNNTELGRDLAKLATAVLGGEPQKHGVTPLRAVRTAFNWRTASHIGLNMDANQQRGFDFLYPEP